MRVGRLLSLYFYESKTLHLRWIFPSFLNSDEGFTMAGHWDLSKRVLENRVELFILYCNSPSSALKTSDLGNQSHPHGCFATK